MQYTLLTKGNLFKTMSKFALPFLLANVLQALYGAADLAIVGQFDTAAATAAVATGSQVMQTITGLCIGLTTGGTVVIGQLFGAGRKKGLIDTAATILFMFAGLAVFLTIVMIAALESICTAMRIPQEAFLPTKEYLFICSFGIIFIIGFNALSGILRGLGDSKTPFYFVAAACLINIAADLLLIGLLGMGPKGAAIATVAAQSLSLGLLTLHLLAKGTALRFLRKKGRPRMAAAKKIMGVGVPISLQDGLVNVSFLIITGIVNGLGVIPAAAVGAVEKLIIFSMLPTTAFASAVAAMTAQHTGAGLIRRSYSCLYLGIFLSSIFGTMFFIASQLFPETLVRFFTADPDVTEAGAYYLKAYSLDCILVCFVFCMNSFLSGRGNVLFPLFHSVLSTFIVRIPLSYILSLSQDMQMFKIGVAAPAATFVSLVLCWVYILFIRRQPQYYSFSSCRSILDNNTYRQYRLSGKKKSRIPPAI